MRTFVFLFLLAVCAPAAGPAAFHVDYTTYLGGSLDDQPAGIAVDSSGNAYIVGTTSSPDFPFTSYDFSVPYQDHPCAFVAKLNPTAGALVWSICLPSAAGAAIALDAAPFPQTVLAAACSLGQVLYAGAAPGLVAGAVQVNVRISAGASTGDRVAIVVYIGNYASGFAGDTTVALR
jgi:hypothetical protein